MTVPAVELASLDGPLVIAHNPLHGGISPRPADPTESPCDISDHEVSSVTLQPLTSCFPPDDTSGEIGCNNERPLYTPEIDAGREWRPPGETGSPKGAPMRQSPRSHIESNDRGCGDRDTAVRRN